MNDFLNADYYGRRGVVIIKKKDCITLSNPGGSRIELDTAVSGGVSDPRNSAMLKMFNFIDIGERAGSGIPNIFRVWKEQGWARPTFSESFEPERVTLSLPLIKGDDKKVTIKGDDKKVTIVCLNTRFHKLDVEITGRLGKHPFYLHPET